MTSNMFIVQDEEKIIVKAKYYYTENEEKELFFLPESSTITDEIKNNSTVKTLQAHFKKPNWELANTINRNSIRSVATNDGEVHTYTDMTLYRENILNKLLKKIVDEDGKELNIDEENVKNLDPRLANILILDFQLKSGL